MAVKVSDRFTKKSSGNELVDCLTTTLADVYNMYAMAHGAHWNVEGIEFAQYHDLFGDISDDVFGSIDPIAENIRKMGYLAPTTLDEFVANRSFAPSPLSQDPKQMAQALASQNNIVLSSLKEAFEDADEANEQGIANFIAERIDMHQKWAWQLRSSAGSNVHGRASGFGPSEDKLKTIRRQAILSRSELTENE